MNPEDFCLNAIASFLRDPPGNLYQRGYLAALLAMARDCGWSDRETVRAGEDLMAATR